MNVLVIGSGCREHALIKALQEDSQVKSLYSLPARESLKALKSLPSSLLNQPDALAKSLLMENIELVIVGPEQPLVQGLSDKLRKHGIKVFGPSQGAAQLEGSKVFAKKFMKDLRIPTASYHIVRSVSETLQSAKNFFPPYVLKADGLAGGKGVFICNTKADLEEKSRFLFEKKGLGSAGEQALLEDFQQGTELSVFVLSNGSSYSILPIAQDYKRLLDGHKGPNTGGMGAIAPVSVNKELLNSIENFIIKPTLEGLRKKNLLYYGVLYLGLMIHKNIPKLLEYNVRWGDPEAQVLLPLLDGSWLDVFYKIASGQDLEELQWKKNQHSACVVLSSSNYPESPAVSSLIEGNIHFKTENSYFIHGALKKQEERWFTHGGRVLNAMALGNSPEQALHRAYEQARKVSWSGIQYRKDIGVKTKA